MTGRTTSSITWEITMRRIHDTRLVFLHIPKTAGMAVLNAFGMDHKPSDHSYDLPEDINFINGDYLRFCVLRDPITRFISAYRYSIKMLNHSAGNAIRNAIIENYLKNDINKFIHFYKNQPEILLNNMHFRPQWFYIKICKPVIMLRHENLQEEIRLVAEMAPQYFKKLEPVNVSKPSKEIYTQLHQKNFNLLREWYSTDLLLTGIY